MLWASVKSGAGKRVPRNLDKQGRSVAGLRGFLAGRVLTGVSALFVRLSGSFVTLTRFAGRVPLRMLRGGSVRAQGPVRAGWPCSLGSAWLVSPRRVVDVLGVPLRHGHVWRVINRTPWFINRKPRAVRGFRV